MTLRCIFSSSAPMHVCRVPGISSLTPPLQWLCLVPTAFLDLLMSKESRKHKHGPCLVCTRDDIFDIVQSVPIPVLDDLSIVYLLLSWYAMDWYRSC